MKSAVLIAVLGVWMAVGFGQSVPDPAAQLLQYRKDLEARRNSSLAHFRIAEIMTRQGDYQSAGNEFREALSGDLQPRWIEVWSHVDLGEIYELTGQRDRAANEYRLAIRTDDNTQGALTEARAHLRVGGCGHILYRAPGIAEREPNPSTPTRPASPSLRGPSSLKPPVARIKTDSRWTCG